jgi:hypothetical protein
MYQTEYTSSGFFAMLQYPVFCSMELIYLLKLVIMATVQNTWKRYTNSRLMSDRTSECVAILSAMSAQAQSACIHLNTSAELYWMSILLRDRIPHLLKENLLSSWQIPKITSLPNEFWMRDNSNVRMTIMDFRSMINACANMVDNIAIHFEGE